ncbi:hypothetical protein BJX62DRAFT_183090 [Aspergillus germanicus]
MSLAGDRAWIYRLKNMIAGSLRLSSRGSIVILVGLYFDMFWFSSACDDLLDVIPSSSL